MRDLAAAVIVLVGGLWCLMLVLAQLAGVKTETLRGKCTSHHGVTQIDRDFWRRDTFIVICRDGSIHKVSP